MTDIFLWGASSHAQCVINIIHKEKKYNIKFLFDPTLPERTSVCGYDVFCELEELKSEIASQKIKGYIIAIGDNYVRRKMHDQHRDILADLEFVTTVDPTAHIQADVKLGKGVVVMGGAYLEPSAVMEDGAWIGIYAVLGHDCQVGSFSSVAMNSALGGKVVVGNTTAISMSVTIVNKLHIGHNTLVGAGSLVTRSIGDGVLAFGSPAKVIRERALNEVYL
ncbi:NeuD/PglB/VioB family sugar acetyltransferase [Pontibacter pamirensis]|uniref:NeuD/PglB/VioB family sugar acetyltransferase n=1 Tax=Pontibacter pamirensis TaxID=2562824 RepID=UPI00138980B6|nr:NeuD/PglB/VioB family sugar acetyltransferase [Pontibacter pamirensis]